MHSDTVHCRFGGYEHTKKKFTCGFSGKTVFFWGVSKIRRKSRFSSGLTILNLQKRHLKFFFRQKASKIRHLNIYFRHYDSKKLDFALQNDNSTAKSYIAKGLFVGFSAVLK